MVQAFLNQPTLEAAREVYLESFERLPSVQARWNGKRPTQDKFDKEFKRAWEKRQQKLAKAEGGSVALLDKDRDSVQHVAETLVALLSGAIIPSPEPGYEEPEEYQEDSELDTESLTERLAAMLRGSPSARQSGDSTKGKTKEAVKNTDKTVKPENAGKTPSVDQIYFLVHRAIESGNTYAQLPVRRDDAAFVIGLIKDGRDYEGAMRAWRRR